MTIFESLSSWSFSRERMLRECPRKFHYHYIAARGGHRPGGPPGSREAWLAKQYSAIPIEVGSLVHKSVAKVFWGLVGGHSVDIAIEAEEAMATFVESILASMRGTGDKRFLNHVFGPEFEYPELEAAARSIGEMIENFAELPFVKALVADPSSIMIRYLDCDRPEISTAFGFPAWIKMDLALRQPGQRFDIVEWKTGRPSAEHVLQAQLYAAFLWNSEMLQPGAVTTVHIAYLKTGHVEPHEFDEADRRLALLRAEEGFKTIESLFAERTAACLDPARFPTRPGRHCAGCNFQGLCAASAAGKGAAVTAAAAPLVVDDGF